jgi:hypothetical protein
LFTRAARALKIKQINSSAILKVPDGASIGAPMCSDGAASVMPTANQEWVFVSRPAASGMALTDWDLRDCAMPSLKDGAISSGRTKVIRTPSVTVYFKFH